MTRRELINELLRLIDEHGAVALLWDYTNTIDDDKFKELLQDIKWAIGE